MAVNVFSTTVRVCVSPAKVTAAHAELMSLYDFRSVDNFVSQVKTSLSLLCIVIVEPVHTYYKLFKFLSTPQQNHFVEYSSPEL